MEIVRMIFPGIYCDSCIEHSNTKLSLCHRCIHCNVCKHCEWSIISNNNDIKTSKLGSNIILTAHEGNIKDI